MTIIEKKKRIKNLIDNIPEDNLDEIFSIIQELTSKDEKRKSILLNLLKEEKTLFKKLAQ
ncbi:hypothetical protein CJ739_826 [Mariniflexile rhizosphaerae]|uniref:hypothetical protein n=1 Tax=unclassified Mariniflexile TaxID=2643887 RepID=UPI000CB1614E|nr:hypothetical protein [Mariniflexile sp. TRM1-10]AXP79921.1 hypothetical protein CJ739_826 [Mariniflexile sp. TRM1-10]PLB21076.1 MAG: hypothetical protein TRG1_169 [Flavobacteriaceae bacterium FS1-H7996/R]